PPAPGSAVAAAVVAKVVPGTAKPTTTVTAPTTGRVAVRVTPVRNSPAGATLRIAIPSTAGKPITVAGGGTASSPSSKATINGAGGKRIRVVGLRYRCGLPA